MKLITDRNLNIIALFAALGMGFGAFANSQGIVLPFVLLFFAAMVAHIRYFGIDGGDRDE